MANSIRALFISGEVAPFTESNTISQIVRTLPEQLHETGEYEIRIMMPRYGIISERRNKLHEVIRLSGTEITVDSEKQTLKVKVASIPGIRLQVYFMDNVHYFKRKGILQDRDGKIFDDNAERAVYFGHAVLETIRNLGWNPDIVHSFGWAGSIVPTLLKSVYADEPLFQNARSVYTPDGLETNANFKLATLGSLQLDSPEELVGRSPDEIGLTTSDASIYPPHVDLAAPGVPQFEADETGWLATALDVYEQVSAVVA